VIAEVLNSYALSIDYLRGLLADLPDEKLADQPGGVVNHPLWTIGHLVYSAQMIGIELGMPTWLPEDWATQYGKGSVPSPELGKYPIKDALFERLTDAEHRLKAHLQELGEESMRQPLSDERFRAMMPTLGHAVTHILTTHTGAHLGQVLVWRRVMGFPSLSKAMD